MRFDSSIGNEIWNDTTAIMIVYKQGTSNFSKLTYQMNAASGFNQICEVGFLPFHPILWWKNVLFQSAHSNLWLTFSVVITQSVCCQLFHFLKIFSSFSTNDNFTILLINNTCHPTDEVVDSLMGLDSPWHLDWLVLNNFTLLMPCAANNFVLFFDILMSHIVVATLRCLAF